MLFDRFLSIAPYKLCRLQWQYGASAEARSLPGWFSSMECSGIGTSPVEMKNSPFAIVQRSSP